jgi:hypothetical protein
MGTERSTNADNGRLGLNPFCLTNARGSIMYRTKTDVIVWIDDEPLLVE